MLVLLLFSLCLCARGVQSIDVDWLVQDPGIHANVTVEGNTITLDNGLLRRVFTTQPAFGVIDFVLSAPLEYGGDLVR